MKVQKSKALIAAAAAFALALTACSSSGGGGGGTTSGANTAPPATGSGGTSASASASTSTGGGNGTKGTGAFAECSTKPNTCNSGTTKPGGTVTYTIEKTISGWNLNSAASNTFDYAEALDGVLPGAFTATPDLLVAMNTNLMVSAEQTSDSPQTLVYKVKPNAVWNDGTPIGFEDFKYAYQSQSPVTCPKCAPASTAGYDRIKTITGSDNGKTITVVMSKPFADWKVMFGGMYPAHIAKQHGDDGSPAGIAKSFAWFDANRPAFSGGPYIISNYTKDTSITEVPNPKWYGDVKPSLTKLIFRIITDQTQEVPALKNGEVQAIYPQPSQDLVQQAQAIDGVQTWLGKGLTWEHLDMNTTNQFLKDLQLRTAVFTAISRDDIIKRTVGLFVPGIQPLNNHILLPGQPGYSDTLTATGQGTGNIDKAKQILTAAGYTGVGSSLKTKDGKTVSFRCTYSAGNTLRQETCTIIQNALKQLGIDLKLTAVPDLSVLDKGDFDLIIFAWVGAPFITQGAQQLFTLKGGGDYGKNDDPAATALINQAVGETDQAKVTELLTKADTLLQKDAYSLPLFQKPTFLAANSNIVNLRDNATSVGPPYNVEAWGMKS